MNGALGFTTPGLLLALAALPVIALILRAVPPAPVRRRFPGVALLVGLADTAVQSDRTPPWLLLLRLAALAALILGLAGPVVNPDPTPARHGPLLVVVEGGWPDAAHGPAHAARLAEAVAAAGREGRPVAVLDLARPAVAPVFAEAAAVAPSLAALAPQPWLPQADPLPPFPEGAFDTLWLASGADFAGRTALAARLVARGAVTVLPAPGLVLALSDLRLDGGALAVTAQATAAPVGPVSVQAIGPDPAGVERVLAAATVDLSGLRADVDLDLPPEVRNRIARVTVAGHPGAGAVVLGDDLIRRPKVGLASGSAAGEAQALLSPLHYIRQALAPVADLIEGTTADLIAARPEVLILSDSAHPPEADALAAWVAAGGVLIRFAGPRMAAAEVRPDDPLLPVRLRPGDRSLGGALSWDAPRHLAPFADDGPFAGLTPPGEVEIRAQLVAEPAPELTAATLAALEDGTPLVTRAARGEGQVVLFHVTANTDWSNLPLSGLFVDMLGRLVAGAGPTAAGPRDGIAGRAWQPLRLMDGFGALSPAPQAAPVAGDALAAAVAGPDLRPGLYRADTRVVALNAVAPGQVLAAATDWPAGVTLAAAGAQPQRALGGWLIGAALVLLAGDVLASLRVSGRLGGTLALPLAALLALAPPQARADTDTLPAAQEVALAHVMTGDAQVDAMTARGLRGLSDVLALRTTLEPGPPLAIDPETDDLSLLTLLYWPVTPGQVPPSPAAYARLNRFVASGGMIVFDTRDGDLAGLGAASAAAATLRTLAAPLEIPPLEPAPPDHVLTRAFYLLDAFPGRFVAPLWVEVPTPGISHTDGVSPVLIGGGDWAAAWATDDRGLPLNAIGRGFEGERQREMAYRFGVNLVMHVLTGNYKSDQVHVRQILERLGR